MSLLEHRRWAIMPVLRRTFSNASQNQQHSKVDNLTDQKLLYIGPGNSKNRYLGIWYNKIATQTAVWVANREIPITNRSGILKITNPGILVLLNETGNIIWSSNTSRTVQNPIAQLLESGNLLVKDANDDNPDNFLWQSFDYPCDTLLPGMKLGKNLVTGRDWYLSSWKSNNDPGRGVFTYWLDLRGYPQFWGSNGSVEWYRSGPWNGLRFSGNPSLKKNSIYKFNFVFNKQEVYYSYELLNSSIVSRFSINENGFVQRWTWVDGKGWVLYLSGPTDTCDTYALCGKYGSCNVGNSPVCGCLDKFVPSRPKEWAMGVSTNGCIRRTPLDCEKGDGFLKYSGIKLPDTQYSWFNESMTLKECQTACSHNCTCMAYTTLNISGEGSGCLLWFGDLIDIKEYTENGQDIYIRMASSESEGLAISNGGSKEKKGETIGISLAISMVTLSLIFGLLFYVWRKKQQQQQQQQLKREGRTRDIFKHGYNNESQTKDLELPLLDLATIMNATNDFSESNKLGAGGFGTVYKGMLEGQEIAVKRLSRNSKQGVDEFKNEVICIAKLQHRNLVKLLGCCIQGEEKMLIYEYMPNKSLDSFIFDPTRSTILDWPKRFHIINGIARGLLYLHQDSRLRIIHRDLKASNVLLDIDMNPKISDFGMARSFRGEETEANTSRVVGTYGYMSPEYAVDGFFSIKSDVFSFGVLVLEIVSGKRNRGFFHSDHNLNLLGHAWMVYKEGTSLELLDEAVKDSCHLFEVLRSIHVGLLCVQQHPEDRPTMSSVVLMLGSEGALPCPKQPGFFTERNLTEADKSSGRNAPTSTNEFTITILEPR
ncbi:G-type lectin S-receptor-like serine/threonine-protein kinase At4g27290 isoform X3 [Camellia sinensis]|uniref:G-type lectin S-receptor-like serine/threonine-protein kinase At4g27290 isoform X3 n=1 Tax=Camellia sinensis TaxID=4442 RepID=UPI001035750D|nr:G-type lectin S-receptor-like serine/threonine-protein kinase At4g27290 isoform X3 [Camellia sinensis]